MGFRNFLGNNFQAKGSINNNSIVEKKQNNSNGNNNPKNRFQWNLGKSKSPSLLSSGGAASVRASLSSAFSDGMGSNNADTLFNKGMAFNRKNRAQVANNNNGNGEHGIQQESHAQKMMKGISDRFDHVSQEINGEFQQMRQSLSGEIGNANKRFRQQPERRSTSNSSTGTNSAPQPTIAVTSTSPPPKKAAHIYDPSMAQNNNSNNSSNRPAVIDGDEVILHEIKKGAESIKKCFQNFGKVSSIQAPQFTQTKSSDEGRRNIINNNNEPKQEESSVKAMVGSSKKRLLSMRMPSITSKPTVVPLVGNNMLQRWKDTLQNNVSSPSIIVNDDVEGETVDFLQDNDVYSSAAVTADSVSNNGQKKCDIIEDTKAEVIADSNSKEQTEVDIMDDMEKLLGSTSDIDGISDFIVSDDDDDNVIVDMNQFSIE